VSDQETPATPPETLPVAPGPPELAQDPGTLARLRQEAAQAIGREREREASLRARAETIRKAQSLLGSAVGLAFEAAMTQLPKLLERFGGDHAAAARELAGTAMVDLQRRARAGSLFSTK